MKALVIRQPWAWAIMEGVKRYENRSWLTNYRGPVAIIAGKSTSSLRRGTDFCRQAGFEVPTDLPFGCILGVANLIGIVSPLDVVDPFAEGPHCWVFESPVKLARPVPYTGRLGLFPLPTEVLQTESR